MSTYTLLTINTKPNFFFMFKLKTEQYRSEIKFEPKTYLDKCFLDTIC